MKNCNNSQNEIPDIDGLKIINRLPGWKIEFDELFKFLIGPTSDDLENYYLFKKAYKCCFANVSSRRDAPDIIKSFVIEFAGDIARKYGMDKNGQPEIVDDDYDPQNCINPNVPPFINYLTNSWILQNRFKSFLKKENMTSDKETSYVFTNNDGDEIEVSESSLELYQESEEQEAIVEFINSKVLPMFLSYVDKNTLNVCKSQKQNVALKRNLKMSVFQLYPRIFCCDAFVDNKNDYTQDEYGWYHRHGTSSRSITKGLSIAITWTFADLMKYNPASPPQKTLFECHQLSRNYKKRAPRNVNSENDQDDELRDAVDEYFAPINVSNSLIRLYGEEYNQGIKSRYLTWIWDWIETKKDTIIEKCHKFF